MHERRGMLPTLSNTFKIVWWHSKGRPHAVPKRFKEQEKLVGLSHLFDNHWNLQREWVTDSDMIPDVCGKCFFLRNWSKFLTSFWLNPQPTASRQAATCLQSLHFTCVLGLQLIPHRKCPGNPHEERTRRSSSNSGAALAKRTRIRGSPLITEQTNSCATISRVEFGVNRP